MLVCPVLTCKPNFRVAFYQRLNILKTYHFLPQLFLPLTRIKAAMPVLSNQLYDGILEEKFQNLDENILFIRVFVFTSSTYLNNWLIYSLSYPITLNYIFSSLVNGTSIFEETHFQLLWLLYVAYAILVLASLFGNSVIIHIIRIDNSMKTTTNYLILSQACADLTITIAEMMDVIHYSSMNSLWFGGLFGLITCNLCLLMLFCPAIFSVWILTTIAIERFYAVAQPLRSSPISKHLKKIIFFLLVFLPCCLLTLY